MYPYNLWSLLILGKNDSMYLTMYRSHVTISNGSFTLHGTETVNGNRNGTGNDGFLYYAMYCSHYTGTGTRNRNGNRDQWVAYPFTTRTGTESCTEQ